jgi:UDP-N-acetylmuramoyl-L-alanyl-D-glutamate--2,6-diaminopimelate ligase
MGAIATSLADEVIVTADNPRNEDSGLIIHQIVSGLNGFYRIEPDRAAAIHLGVASAHAGDIVLVAGKGHEDYQEIGGIKHPFSDVAVVQLALGQYKPASMVGVLQ